MPIKRTLFNAWDKAGLPVCLTLALMLAACGPVPAPATIAVVSTEAVPPATHSPDSSSGSAPSETPNPAFTLPQLVPTTEPPVVGEIPADLMARLTDDAQKRAGVAAESIVTLRAEAVTWNDGSLGCPQPGMFYTQALVDGYWVILQVGDVVYDYRTSGTAYFVLCEQPSIAPRPTLNLPRVTVEALTPFSLEVAPVTPVSTNPALPDQSSNPFVKQARADLAARLAIDPAQIALIEFRDVTWPDNSLGCPHPDMGYLQVMVDGYLIRLGVGKQVYEYHGGGARAPFLCENPVYPGN